MTPLIVVRPQPAAARTVALASLEGFDAEAHPLFDLRGRDWEVPSGQFDAIMLSSANALRFGGEALAQLIELPAYVVGERTAQQARAAGFAIAATASDGIDDLADRIAPSHTRVLRLVGADHIDLPPRDGLSVAKAVVYENRLRPMTEALAEILCGPTTVLLHSARAAEHFAQQCTAFGVPRLQVALACLSERTAKAAGRGWRGIAIARETNDAALLETARPLCQSLT